MTHEAHSSSVECRRAVVNATEALVLSVLRALAKAPAAGLPSIVLSEPHHTLVVEEGEFRSATERERRLEFAPRYYRRLARFFGALDAVHRLNSAGRSATLRELFYRTSADGLLFRTQGDMDKAVRDVVGALHVGRPHLSVLASEKGLVAGAIAFSERSVSGAVAISEAMFGDVSVEVGSAHCVLVVEKDSFFQSLLQGRLLTSLPLVLVTGRGYPDLLTRRLLQRLQRTAPQLPQVYLGDYDPHGVSIFLIYLASCPWMRWLGMHDVHVRALPSEASLPFTSRDRALKATLLRRLEGKADYIAQVAAMESKFELEALHSVHGAEEIALHFVPEKILRRAWL